jgi:hypothetical protein
MPQFEDPEYVGYQMAHVPQWEDDDVYSTTASMFPEYQIRGPKVFYARDYLDAFLDIKTPPEALSFLREYGAPENQYVTTFERMRELQGVLRQAAVKPTGEWMTLMPEWEEPTNIETNWHDDGPPKYVSRYEVGVMACLAQIFFERKAGTEFAWCGLEGCGKLFHKKRPDKKYCSLDHQHLAVVRNSRKKAKKS